MVKSLIPPHGPRVPSQSLPTTSRTSPPSPCTVMLHLQCPQASMSLLMLFPLSGMPFLHVLLMPIIFSSGIISSRKTSWTLSLPCWVRCPSLGSHAAAHNMASITFCTVISYLYIWLSMAGDPWGQGQCGSSLNLQHITQCLAHARYSKILDK